MAMLVTGTDRPNPKVWQPWYIEDSDGIRKELPTRSQREQRIRDRIALPKPANPHQFSPSASSEEEEIDVGGVPQTAHLRGVAYSPTTTSYPYEYMAESFEDDAPLDMSVKRRGPHFQTPLPPPAHTPNHTHTPPPSYSLQLQPPPAHSASSPQHFPARLTFPPSFGVRPSVITCASSGYLQQSFHSPKQELSSAPGNVAAYLERFAPPPPYSIAAARLREQRMKSLDGSSPAAPDSGRKSPDRPSSEESLSAKRQVVQVGSVDPEIDEHFRRSLGRNYQELFMAEGSSESLPESNDSVDDHFAKALGDTWTKIKAGKGRNSPSASSLVKSPATPPTALSISPSLSKGLSSASETAPVTKNVVRPNVARVSLSYRTYRDDLPLPLTAKITQT